MVDSRGGSGLELGLDLGSNSLGWALIRVQNGAPAGIVACGVRVFEAGMGGDIEAGRGQSRAAVRRAKKALRRQIERRRRRKLKVLRQLQRMGLLPQGKAQEIIPALDRQYIALYGLQWKPGNGTNLSNLLPYWLRKEALDKQLQTFEIGRAIYHLAQRRGFLSNRKTPKKPGEEDGQVRVGIAELDEAMRASGARTLGEYFSSLDPHDRRIRQRWTHRDMYVAEFRMIWNAQAPHYPDIFTDQNRQRLYKAIFHQRPLKSNASLIGKCELEPNCRRASWSLPVAQRFRYLQVLNNCKVILRDTGEIREFTPEEHHRLVAALEKGDLTFAQAKKLLGFKPKNATFTLESGGEKRFVGNRVNQDIVKAIGDVWFSYPAEKQAGMIADLRQFRDEGALVRRAVNVWRLNADAANAFAAVELEPGYAALSCRAIRKLLPLLEARVPYATAHQRVYGDQLSRDEVLDSLPPVLDHFDVRNPVVLRSLTELRKVVNGIIRKHGKPQTIRIELARDMKQGQRERQRRIKTIRDNESRRATTAEEIRSATGIQNPSDDDILKVQLAKECNWICPYTGRAISMHALVGEASQFDVEHIIPFSRSLDDSFLNKTLCYHEENRHRKLNHMPYEAYHGTEQWDTIIGSVSRFVGPCRDEKLRRFKTTPEEWEQENGGFIARQLNDTRYASKLARAYLGLLYGGFWDATGTQRVFAVTGQVTAIIRNMWDMNAILGDGGPKERSDHRHHAVDAITIAMTTPALVQELADHALPWYERRRYRNRFRQLTVPWESFHEEADKAMKDIIVSHRVEHRVNRALHEETNYAPVQRGGSQTFHVRRALHALKGSEVKQIADARVRAAVEARLHELNAADPSKAFADPRNHPTLTSRTGRATPIHAVRIRVDAKPMPVNANRDRYCVTGSNHHLEVVGVLADDGTVARWEATVVTTYEAMRRVRHRQPVVQRDHGPGRVLLLSIAPGDTIRLANPGGWPGLLHIRTVSQSQAGSIEIAGVDLADARKKVDIKKADCWYRISSLSRLRELGPSRIIVLPDGTVQPTEQP